MHKIAFFILMGLMMFGPGEALSARDTDFLHRIPESEWIRTAPGVWTVRFSEERWPDVPICLHVKGRATASTAASLPLEVRLNESSIFRGKMEFEPGFWRFKRVDVPSGSIRKGPNILEIRGGGVEVQEAVFSDFRFVPVHDFLTNFAVDLAGASRSRVSERKVKEAAPGFKIRGIKGWAWTPEQYLEEIPYLVRARMNFLMNCYTSLFSSLDPFVNTWWEPLPEAKKRGFEKVVRACQKSGITFCFALHPQLFSERPLDLSSDEDFERLWQHFAWMQSLGVTWFSVSYDDIGVEGLDKAVLGEAHARLVNRLLARLRDKTPEAQIVFCPVYYWGCGDGQEARAYLGALARTLDPDVYVFWTGNGVVTTRITLACAEAYRSVVGHRLIIWDNYPVNDRQPTIHLGPVTGREPELAKVADGYMSNPLCPQNEANRLPLFTCAEYALRPAAYDPLGSIGRAIGELAETPAQKRALKDLVELYPGMLISGSTSTGFNPVLEKFDRLLEEPSLRHLAAALLARVERAEKELAAAFPGRYRETRETLRGHIARMREQRQ